MFPVLISFISANLLILSCHSFNTQFSRVSRVRSSRCSVNQAALCRFSSFTRTLQRTVALGGSSDDYEEDSDSLLVASEELEEEQSLPRDKESEEDQQGLKSGFQEVLETVVENDLLASVMDAKVRDDIFLVAAMKGRNDLVKSLLDKGADIYAVIQADEDSVHMSALSLAISEGHLYTVTILLDRGADINGRLTNGFSPLMLAARYRGSSKRKSVQIVNLLIDKGADIEAQDREVGLTPLMVASFFGNLKTVQALLQRGANVHAVDKDGYTAAWYATYHSHISVMNVLLKSGADFDAKDKLGRSILMTAVIEGNAKSVKYLLDSHRCDVRARDKVTQSLLYTVMFGVTVIEHALKSRNMDVKKLFAERVEGFAALNSKLLI